MNDIAFKPESIHFVGMKGVGMAPLAIIAKEAGFKVTGCDSGDKFITDEILKNAGIECINGFSESHIKSADLVITTGAHGGYDNPEVKAAKSLGIPILTQGEAVGEFMKGEMLNKKTKGISVAGTHGKTTTTAMISTILKEAGKDPTFVIGTGYIPSLGTAGHFGKGEYFVAEADEYVTEPVYNKKVKFLWQFPKILVVTNIEFDHPDVYKNVDEVRGAFAKYIKQIPRDGLLVTNGDDKQVKKLLLAYNGSVKTFGLSKENTYVVVPQENGNFQLFKSNKLIGNFNLSIVGKHNMLNATAAIIVALHEGIALETIQKAISKFGGTKRRLEYRKKLKNGAIVYDDYAHHPSEIKSSLRALREKYPNMQIICIFQPHTYSRTKELFEEFSSSFKDADLVILPNIYSSKREKPDATISSEMLADAVTKRGRHALFIKSLPGVVQYLNALGPDKNILIVTMGAGDVYEIVDSLE